PTNTGYSYGGDPVNVTSSAADDVYAFLQLWFHHFPNYKRLDFHIAGESYAGHFIPAIAAKIHNNNKISNFPHINLESILIGNALLNPLVQLKQYPDMACNTPNLRVISNHTCDQMRQRFPICASEIQKCYDSKDTGTCKNATFVCYTIMIQPYMNNHKKRSLYDMRRRCDDGKYCYSEAGDFENFCNIEEVKTQLGVDPSFGFAACNFLAPLNFAASGDVALRFDQLIPPLLESKIRVLIYAGDVDYLLNWLGNKAWVKELGWSGKKGFNEAKVTPWITKKTIYDPARHAGDVKTYKELTFLRIFEAGHMPPYDQRSACQDFFKRWLSKEAL
ncbi:36963_t:CDS:2, partial [Racocetra persica]